MQGANTSFPRKERKYEGSVTTGQYSPSTSRRFHDGGILNLGFDLFRRLTVMKAEIFLHSLSYVRELE